MMIASCDEDREDDENDMPDCPPVRHTYQPPSDSSSSTGIEMAVIQSYMKDTRLEAIMGHLCHLLLSQPKLPYNPYPGFVRRLRHLAEGFHTLDKHGLSSQLFNTVLRTGVPGMWGVRDCDNVWGTKYMASVVNGRCLKQYDWLIQSITPSAVAGVDKNDGYLGQILLALVGPTAFTGAFYSEVSCLNIRLEYVIYGSDINVGLDMFVNSIMQDTEKTARDDCPHHLLGVNVLGSISSSISPTPSSSVSSVDSSLHGNRPSHTTLLSRSIHTRSSQHSTDTPQNSGTDLASPLSEMCVWSVNDIHGRRDEFLNAMRSAVKKKKLITQQCAFLVNKDTNEYKLGNKQFVLHFIETSDDDSEEESLSSFADLPYTTLHEGIFPKKAHSETYMMTMGRHPHIARLISEAPSTRPVDYERIQQMNLAQLHKQGSDKQGEVVCGEIIVNPIRLKFEHELSLLDPILDAFKVIHLALNVILMERTKWKTGVLVEMHHVLHSTAFKWYNFMRYNTMIQQIIEYKLLPAQQQDASADLHITLLKSLMSQYKVKLLQVLDTSLHDRPADQHTIHTIVTTRIQHLRSYLNNEHIDYNKIMQDLVHIQLYCTTVSLHLIEDAMPFFQQFNLQEFLKRVHKKIPVPESQPSSTSVISTKTKVKVNKKKSKMQVVNQKSTTQVKPVVILHGVEDSRITQQQNQFIIVEDARQDSSCPRIMATEAVFIQYLVDVKLDAVWHDFLLSLLSKPWLPPNPYPSLVTELRQTALRMHLCFESDTHISKQILHGQSKLIDKVNGVYNIPGCNAFGDSAALAGIDTSSSGFRKIAALAKGVANTLVISRKGQYQIFCGLAICDLCPLYGKVLPYLNELLLDEHYYIKGPMGAHSYAIQLFAKLVFDHIMGLNDLNMYVVIGVFLGGIDVYPIDQVVTSKEEFMTQLMHAVEQKQNVYIKLYQSVGWRYIGIKKHMKFQYLYVDRAKDRSDTFYPSSLTQNYQSVFLTLKEASFHFCQAKNGSPVTVHNSTASVNKALDKQMRNVMRDSDDMIQMYKMMVTKTLINKNEVCIAELWRVLHSVTFQLDYVSALNQALQDLIQWAIENPKQYTPLKIPAAKKGVKYVKVLALKETSLLQLMKAFSDKVYDIIQEPCVFAPIALTQLLKERFSAISGDTSPTDDAITSTRSSTQSGHSIIHLRTIGLLQDIADILRPLQDINARDVLLICPHTQKVFNSVMSQGETYRDVQVK